MLFFQHNNVRAAEWIAIRRELLFNLERIDDGKSDFPEITRITVLRPALFAVALRVAEGWDPKNKVGGLAGTSPKVYKATQDLKDMHPLSPILTGPVAALSFPGVETKYLKVALEVLFPTKYPKKGMDPLAVTGVQKFVLLAGRVDGHVYGGRNGEGRVLDGELVRYLARQPDVESLRGQLMAMLRGAGGADLVMNLSNVGVGLARTVDARRKMLSGELNADGEKKEGE
jgi:large subunit ribosomal protein L10